MIRFFFMHLLKILEVSDKTCVSVKTDVYLWCDMISFGVVTLVSDTC